MKVSRTFLLTLGAILMISCQKSNIEEDTPQSKLIHLKDETKFQAPVVWMAAQDEFSADFSKRSSVFKSDVTEDDKVIFTNVDNAKTFNATLKKAYDNGAAIIFVKPDIKKVVEFMKESSFYHMYPTSDTCLFYAISKRGACSFRKPLKCSPKPIITDIEGAESALSGLEFKNLDQGWVDPYADFDSNDPSYFIGPLVKWINGAVEPYTKSTSDTRTAEFKDILTWDCDLFVHNCGASSSDDRIKGLFQAGFSHKYKPLFCQSSGEGYSSGDFYEITTDYTADPSGVWKGDDFVNKHGGIYVHITGAFIKSIDFKTFISGDGSYPYFYCQPQPSTDKDKVSYSESSGFDIGGGISLGINANGKSGKQMVSGEASFQWGYHETNTVSASVSDVGVINNSIMSDSDNGTSIGSSAAWQFKYNNLPKPSGDKGFNRECPASARSYQSFPTQWVWCTKSHEAGTTTSIGNLVTKIHPVLGGCHNGLCVDGQENTWDLGEQRSSAAMVVPNRIIFGSIKIMNDLGENYVLHGFEVKNISSSVVYLSTDTDIIYNNGLEVSLPADTYSISAIVWDKSTKTDKAYVLASYNATQRTSEDDVKIISFARNFKEK